MRSSPRRALVLAPFLGCALLLANACDDKGKGPPGLAPMTSNSAPAPSGTVTASASLAGPTVAASASASASAAGACARLSSEKADRCNKLSGGDPTILTTCKEGIDALVKAADDAKCLKAMTPQTEAPSDEPD